MASILIMVDSDGYIANHYMLSTFEYTQQCSKTFDITLLLGQIQHCTINSFPFLSQISGSLRMTGTSEKTAWTQSEENGHSFISSTNRKSL